jgi:hypothetical protein
MQFYGKKEFLPIFMLISIGSYLFMVLFFLVRVTGRLYSPLEADPPPPSAAQMIPPPKVGTQSSLDITPHGL